MASLEKFPLGISTSLVDDDAVRLVRSVADATRQGGIPNAFVACVVATKERDESETTDRRIQLLEEMGVPIVAVSAKKHGRLGISKDDSEGIDRYDRLVLGQITQRNVVRPKVMMMLGDMIIHGKHWCETMPSLNLHPDLPLSMGGVEGIYWEVIGQWVRQGRIEGGGMVHLAIPKLDAGTPVTYFRIPLDGIVNGVDLGAIRQNLPSDRQKLDELVQLQVALKSAPTHPYFLEVRRAEAAFEEALVVQTLASLAGGEIAIQNGQVVNSWGRSVDGLDLTQQVVGENAIWPR